MDKKTSFTPGPYRPGRAYNSIVSDSKDGNAIFGVTDQEYQAYGGYLIAESISPNNIPILMASTEMFEVLSEVYELILSPVSSPVASGDELAVKIANVLKKARGEA
jgi:hypothetical protein